MKSKTVNLIGIYLLGIFGFITTIIGAYHNSAYSYTIGIILTLLFFSLRFLNKEHYSKEPKGDSQ